MSKEQTASERVYGWVRQRILDGTLVGGDMISEGEMAQDVGVSRTPVREAFLRLDAEGLLRLFPKRGAVVVSMTPSDARQMFEARLLIEPWAVQAAARLDDRASLVDALEAAIADLERADGADPVAYQEADRAFHEAILDAAGNALLADFYGRLRDRQLRVGAQALAGSRERARTIPAEHREIARAIAAGDASTAVNAVRVHIERTRRALG